MRIYIVRHAETEFNVLGINQGHRDSPISETGKWQIRMIAERLKDEKIDACYSSDLLRAVKTAEVIMGMHPGKKVMLSKEIREGNIGVFSGKPQGSMSRYAQEKNIDFFSFVQEEGSP
jgi:broad specificity phosphatase PhoE